MNALINELVHPLWAAATKDLNGAGLTSLWVNMKNMRRLSIYLIGGAWAAGTPAFTLLQATSNAGAGSKALNFDRYWRITGAQTSGNDVPTEVSLSSTNTFNLVNGANRMYWLEVMATHLDNNNGFTHVGFTVADPSAACLLGAMMLGGELSHPAYPTRQLTAYD